MCGENEQITAADRGGVRAIPACAGRTPDDMAACEASGGPSPRVRGERQGWPGPGADARAIPACAGRTAETVATYAHQCGPSPRVRGERPRAAPTRKGRAGHPRVCGENAFHPTSTGGSGRAIPACAGRTRLAGGVPGAEDRAIPACAGRTPKVPAPVRGWNGPSPRVRGEPTRRTRAWRGSSGHPRVCGENQQQAP